MGNKSSIKARKMNAVITGATKNYSSVVSEPDAEKMKPFIVAASCLLGFVFCKEIYLMLY